MCNDISNRDLERHFKNNVWVTEQYTLIPLSRMSDEHIEKAIKLIIDCGPDSCYGYGKEWFRKLLAERMKRNCTCGK